MATPREALKSYWGYQEFRPLQEEIIESVLQGQDTLALLPTGGGKSICFQVPGLIKSGLTLVISPLIALMKDQVSQLKSREILAEAVHAGMTRREIDITLDNCINSDVKFLYLSPERLKTELFVERIKILHQKRGVAQIAVDEAHCISQWGYDFRPSYLEIAAIREILPDVPIIALTATATEKVKKDIQEKLRFENGKVFIKSFARPNLSYSVRFEEHKDRKLVEVLQKIEGSAVVYVNTRRRTKELAFLLQRHQISADFYHAGLEFSERSLKQEDWIHGRTRVIVSTNAFGMGIDKADVRLVVHMDLPPNLESYYQEAGRAGRDEKKAYALIICNQKDIEDLRRKTQQSLPEENLLKEVYQMLGNHFQLAVGNAPLESFDFDIQQFGHQFDRRPIEIFNSIKTLESQGLISLSEAFYQPSRAVFKVDHKELYEFQIANASYDSLIKAMLRIHGGELYNSPVHLKESSIMAITGDSLNDCRTKLAQLHDRGIMEYFPQKDKPQLSFISERYGQEKLPLDIPFLKGKRKLTLDKMESVISYLHNEDRCRTQQLLEYFGEVSYEKCQVCDNCISLKKSDESGRLKNHYQEQINKVITSGSALDVSQLTAFLSPQDKDVFMELISEMLDHGLLFYDDFGKLKSSKS